MRRPKIFSLFVILMLSFQLGCQNNEPKVADKQTSKKSQTESDNQSESKQELRSQEKTEEKQTNDPEVQEDDKGETGNVNESKSELDINPVQETAGNKDDSDSTESEQSKMPEDEKSVQQQTADLVQKIKDEQGEAPEFEDIFKPAPLEIDLPESAKQVGDREIWIDQENKQVIVGGKICLREGGLEMFACLRGTKEHESVVSANALASQVHACFLLLGFEPGSPVEWEPEYKPASGPKIEIDVVWKHGDAVKRVPAQEMCRNWETKEAMKTHWVFGGSQVYKFPDGETQYYGDAGELVCLSNFSTATMDIPIESADNDAALLFQAYTENIPAVNTQVYLFFKPQKVEEKKEEQK